MQGRVIKLISNKWTVLTDNGLLLECSCIGKFKYLKESPLVGDLVIVDEKNKVINKILPRKNVLIRPPVANIDQALILTSTIEPSFSSNLLVILMLVISAEYRELKKRFKAFIRTSGILLIAMKFLSIPTQMKHSFII